MVLTTTVVSLSGSVEPSGGPGLPGWVVSGVPSSGPLVIEVGVGAGRDVVVIVRCVVVVDAGSSQRPYTVSNSPSLLRHMGCALFCTEFELSPDPLAMSLHSSSSNAAGPTQSQSLQSGYVDWLLPRSVSPGKKKKAHQENRARDMSRRLTHK